MYAFAGVLYILCFSELREESEDEWLCSRKPCKQLKNALRSLCQPSKAAQGCLLKMHCKAMLRALATAGRAGGKLQPGLFSMLAL